MLLATPIAHEGKAILLRMTRYPARPSLRTCAHGGRRGERGKVCKPSSEEFSPTLTTPRAVSQNVLRYASNHYPNGLNTLRVGNVQRNHPYEQHSPGRSRTQQSQRLKVAKSPYVCSSSG